MEMIKALWPKGSLFQGLSPYRDHCLGLYWVPIHISASLFPVFCLNARDKFAAKLKYGDHQSSSSWKWFCVTLLATFTSAYALGFINSRQGSLF